MIDRKDLEPWRRLVGETARYVGRVRPLDGPVGLKIEFVLPRPFKATTTTAPHTDKPDLDKLVRAINDALTGIAFADDSQVVYIEAAKRYVGPSPDEKPHALIRIHPFA